MDSDDDCYSNAAKKFQSLKSEYKSINRDENKKKCSESNDIINITDSVPSETILDDCNTSVISDDSDDLYIDNIIAKNKKATPKGGRKRKVPEANLEPSCDRVTRNRRQTALTKNTNVNNIDVIEILALDSDSETTKSNKGKRGKSATNRSNSVKRTKGRGNNNARSTTRGRGRVRNSRRNIRGQDASYITFNIGDAEEYPDTCGDQQLFSSARTTTDDVEIIEDDPLENENEEISVKVEWQSTQVFRFKIRKYQKLTQIFKYFSEKENVPNGNLLFMYNDRIVRADDTPDSINYNIAKFIDGGMVHQDVTTLAKPSSSNLNSRREVNDGFRIKFQCQSLKKPFETTVTSDEKLSTAMMLCAEYLELPMRQLKFYFDGDLITYKMTPRELGLESGDCIDVKICS